MKHTQGKWGIGKINTHDGLAYHFEVFVNNGIGGKHIISESVLEEDNANLIAAAPEMLGALKGALKYLKNQLYMDGHTTELLDTYEIIKSAIVKAEGE